MVMKGAGERKPQQAPAQPDSSVTLLALFAQTPPPILVSTAHSHPSHRLSLAASPSGCLSELFQGNSGTPFFWALEGNPNDIIL